jgi:membrane-associated protein
MEEFFSRFVQLFTDTNVAVDWWVAALGVWIYLGLFLILFCETGLVVTPVLPGDSLLFAVGAVAVRGGSPLSLPLLMGLLMAAAILGDAVNYAIGYRLGPRVFRWEKGRFFNREHLVKTQAFYEKYGGVTIILARFVPFARTFAPFVAGIGRMQYRRFALFNVVGGIGWVGLCLGLGAGFGNLPVVQRNFKLVILAIIVISVLPLVIAYLRSRRSTPEPAPARVSEPAESAA